MDGQVGADYLLIGPANKENVEDDRVEIMQLPDVPNEQCGPIIIVRLGQLEAMRYRGNIARVIREI